jgi:DNA (cytosine-5)-methyltransferase 1
MIKSKTVCEYFAGIGLVRMGLESNGWRVVFANDISEKKSEMYKAFYPDSNNHYVIGDVFDLDPLQIPTSTLATCSFPCIDLSLAGNMSGINGKHSSAYWGFINVLRTQGDYAPRIVMVENVPGWLRSNGGADFRLTVQALNELGYACDVFTVDALRFSPQSRLRVFLIGLKDYKFPDAAWSILTRSSGLLSSSLKTCILDNLDLDWTYMEVPEPPSLKDGGLSSTLEKIDEKDTRWWSDEDVWKHMNMMDEAHYLRVKQLAAQEEFSYRTFFRRRRNGEQRAEVRDDDISGCLRTAIGGSGRQFIIKAGFGGIYMRAMTPREYARLQGVPDSYRISVPEVQALTGFGDAVCVPVISWIAKNVLDHLLLKTPREEVALV